MNLRSLPVVPVASVIEKDLASEPLPSTVIELSFLFSFFDTFEKGSCATRIRKQQGLAYVLCFPSRSLLLTRICEGLGESGCSSTAMGKRTSRI